MPSRRNPEEIVPILMKWLNKTKERVGIKEGTDTKDPMVIKFKEIEGSLEGMRDLLPTLLHTLKNWEDWIMEEFNKLEKDINNDIFEKDRSTPEMILSKLDSISKNFKLVQEKIDKIKLPPVDKTGTTGSWQIKPSDAQARKMSETWNRLKVEENVLGSPAMANLQVSYDRLTFRSKLCSLSFSIFPDNYEIKKRPLINWWIAEGFITKAEFTPKKAEKTTGEEVSISQKEGSISPSESKTADEVGEEIFQELITAGLIEPVHEKKHPAVNSCKMHPWIRRMLISVAKKAQLFNFDPKGTPTNDTPQSNDPSRSRHACLISGRTSPKEDDLLTLFNVNEQYLDLKAKWFSELKKLVVLHLGRWQASAVHHLEVENPEFLKNLGTQKHLKYLGLQGVSRITKLPPSLVELINLEILDLRACHNLEELSFDISPLRKLTYLDLSECYVLGGMPKGLDKLYSLQVLKGFLIGKPWSTDCKFADLVELKKLRKLSICIGREATSYELDLNELKDITTLRILAITWEKVDPPKQSSPTKESKGEKSGGIATATKNKDEKSSETAKSPTVKASEELENKAEQSSGNANSALGEGSKAMGNKNEQSSETANSTMEEASKESEIKAEQSSGSLIYQRNKGEDFPASKNQVDQQSIPPKNSREVDDIAELRRKITFPPKLEKLDLWCLPCWPHNLNPTDLTKLKKLYIRGGKVDSFPIWADKLETKWEVEILRLKYLKDLEVEQELLLKEFPESKYLQKVKCKGKDFEWTKPEKVETKPKKANTEEVKPEEAKPEAKQEAKVEAVETEVKVKPEKASEVEENPKHEETVAKPKPKVEAGETEGKAKPEKAPEVEENPKH